MASNTKKFLALLAKQEKPLAKLIRQWLKKQGKQIANLLVSKLYPAEKVDLRVALGKALTQAQIDAIVDAIDLGDMQILSGLITENTINVWREAYAEGKAVGGMMVDMELVAEEALSYSKTRSAELVGMRVLPSGKVVKNPNPEWSISETTRKIIRAQVTKALNAGSSAKEFADAIEGSHAFSNTRSMNIARTELSFAFNNGNLQGWADSGVPVFKQSLLSDTYDLDDECRVAANDGAIPLERAFSNGKMAPAYHPNCKCTLSPVVQKKAKKVDVGALLRKRDNSPKQSKTIDIRLLRADNSTTALKSTE